MRLLSAEVLQVTWRFDTVGMGLAALNHCCQVIGLDLRSAYRKPLGWMAKAAARRAWPPAADRQGAAGTSNEKA